MRSLPRGSCPPVRVCRAWNDTDSAAVRLARNRLRRRGAAAGSSYGNACAIAFVPLESRVTRSSRAGISVQVTARSQGPAIAGKTIDTRSAALVIFARNRFPPQRRGRHNGRESQAVPARWLGSGSRRDDDGPDGVRSGVERQRRRRRRRYGRAGLRLVGQRRSQQEHHRGDRRLHHGEPGGEDRPAAG